MLDMNTIALIVGAVVAGFLALMARENGKKVGEKKGIEIGQKQAVTEVKAQSTEQALERVVKATEARAGVEHSSDRVLSDAAHADRNNRLGGV